MNVDKCHRPNCSNVSYDNCSAGRHAVSMGVRWAISSCVATALRKRDAPS